MQNESHDECTHRPMSAQVVTNSASLIQRSMHTEALNLSAWDQSALETYLSKVNDKNTMWRGDSTDGMFFSQKYSEAVGKFLAQPNPREDGMNPLLEFAVQPWIAGGGAVILGLNPYTAPFAVAAVVASALLHKPDPGTNLENLANLIFQQLNEVIDKKILQSKLQGRESAWKGFLENINLYASLYPNMGDADDAELDGRIQFLTSLHLDKTIAVRGVIFGTCPTDQNSGNCKSWQQAGAVIDEIAFATVHLTLIAELAKNKAMKGDFEHAKIYGKLYVSKKAEYGSWIDSSAGEFRRYLGNEYFSATMYKTCFSKVQTCRPVIKKNGAIVQWGQKYTKSIYGRGPSCWPRCRSRGWSGGCHDSACDASMNQMLNDARQAMVTKFDRSIGTMVSQFKEEKIHPSDLDKSLPGPCCVPHPAGKSPGCGKCGIHCGACGKPGTYECGNCCNGAPLCAR